MKRGSFEMFFAMLVESASAGILDPELRRESEKMRAIRLSQPRVTLEQARAQAQRAREASRSHLPQLKARTIVRHQQENTHEEESKNDHPGWNMAGHRKNERNQTSTSTSLHATASS